MEDDFELREFGRECERLNDIARRRANEREKNTSNGIVLYSNAYCARYPSDNPRFFEDQKKFYSYCDYRKNDISASIWSPRKMKQSELYEMTLIMSGRTVIIKANGEGPYEAGEWFCRRSYDKIPDKK